MPSAFWTTLYTGGHDAARIVETRDGWQLDGVAVFALDGQPAGLRYQLTLASDWTTRSGSIDGLLGDEAIAHRIVRDGAGWLLDDVRQTDLDEVVDLDFGFTPATNFPQLRRIALGVGERTEFTVAWFDLGESRLQPLLQCYARTSDDAYAYESPQGDYRETLRIAESGFVQDYPGLWKLDTRQTCG